MRQDCDSQTGTTLRVLLRDPADPAAWRAFVARYGSRIYAWSRRWGLQDADAQNVTQDVLAKLVQALRRFSYDPSRGTFRGWLKTVAHHAWRDYLDAQRRPGAHGSGDTAALEGLAGPCASDDLSRALDEEFERELLEEAKARVQLQVSPRDWRLFHALAVEGRPGAEVAAELGMKVAAVFVARGRVQRKLRAEVRRLGGARGDQREISDEDVSAER